MSDEERERNPCGNWPDDGSVEREIDAERPALLELAGELQFEAADISHDLLAYPDEDFRFPGDIGPMEQRLAAHKYAQARAVYEAWRDRATMDALTVDMELFLCAALPPARYPDDYGACEEP